jgi:hypothetical protein
MGLLCAEGHSTGLANGTLFADNSDGGKLSKQRGVDAFSPRIAERENQRSLIERCAD